MFRNYIIVALRNIRKYKGFSLINIAGLAIGIASCLMILVFVRSELSYDRFHDKAERIYRVGFTFHVGTNQFDAALGPCPLAAALVNDFPEVEKAARIFARQSRGGDVFVRYGEKRYKEDKFLWTDPELLNILTIPFIKGSPGEALAQPNSVVMTAETAVKYFGQEEPIGKMLELGDGSLYMVNGVTESWPGHSHFHFDFLASFSSLPKSEDLDYYDTAVFTYILLRENASIDELESKLPEFSGKCMAPIIEKIMAVPYEEFLDSGNFIGFMTQPLRDIHLRSKWGNELEPQGSFNTVIIFSAIAMLILIVACINFINLTTARSTQRANEVGVRKVVGSSRGQLVRQFLSESVFLSFLSFLLALIFVELALPVFNTLVGKEFSSNHILDWPFLLILLFGAIIIGIAAGSYPAFLMASFRPVFVLKGKIQSSMRGRRFRDALVVFQFCASVVLLVGTAVIFTQLHYIRNKELGFDKEHVVVIQRAEKLGSQQLAFKNQLYQNPAVLNATFTDSLPQILLEAKVFQKEGAGSQENNTLITITADYDLLETYGLEMISGRYFERERSTDTEAVVLNETAIKALDIQDPLEKRFVLVGLKRRPMDIIGIINDFHMESLHTKIGPTAVILFGTRPSVLLSVRVRPGDLPKTLGFLEDKWSEFTNNQPFEYVFFDDQFDMLYKAEIQAGKVITAFACLAVFIACLGLLGLASFTASQRTKEIGIRKVLGATTSGILVLLNKDFVKRVLVANLIAWPLAYYAMNKWLQNFAYRIRINIWMFLASSVIALLIAFFTVSYQTFRAARGNPVDSLRYE
ncbi:MAG: ABC transporter permease [Candidatus Aminicenantes bacterium]|nr:MAG: ABC transporter permease [Candidatus Aminicenantes bacterium]